MIFLLLLLVFVFPSIFTHTSRDTHPLMMMMIVAGGKGGGRDSWRPGFAVCL